MTEHEPSSEPIDDRARAYMKLGDMVTAGTLILMWTKRPLLVGAR